MCYRIAAHVRINPDRWPPMHTEIVRHRYIPDRASVMMESMPGGFTTPYPPIVSLVTGRRSYDHWNARDILRQWTDQPQRLWDVVYETLAAGVTTVVHVGAEPDITPATFRRLSDNVEQQAAAPIWKVGNEGGKGHGAPTLARRHPAVARGIVACPRPAARDPRRLAHRARPPHQEIAREPRLA